MPFAYVDIVGVTGSIPVAPTTFIQHLQVLSASQAKPVNEALTALGSGFGSAVRPDSAAFRITQVAKVSLSQPLGCRGLSC